MPSLTFSNFNTISLFYLSISILINYRYSSNYPKSYYSLSALSIFSLSFSDSLYLSYSCFLIILSTFSLLSKRFNVTLFLLSVIITDRSNCIFYKFSSFSLNFSRNSSILYLYLVSILENIYYLYNSFSLSYYFFTYFSFSYSSSIYFFLNSASSIFFKYSFFFSISIYSFYSITFLMISACFSASIRSYSNFFLFSSSNYILFYSLIYIFFSISSLYLCISASFFSLAYLIRSSFSFLIYSDSSAFFFFYSSSCIFLILSFSSISFLFFSLASI